MVMATVTSKAQGEPDARRGESRSHAPCPLALQAPSERGDALGLNEAVASVFRVIMPTLAGSIVDAIGPRAPFALQAALSIAGAAVLAWLNDGDATDKSD